MPVGRLFYGQHSSLRVGTTGTWRYLARDCARCRPGVLKYALSGGTFSVMQPAACSPQSPLRPNEPLIFLGGSNDEVLWWALDGQGGNFTGKGTFLKGLYYLRHPSAKRVKALYDENAARSRQHADSLA